MAMMNVGDSQQHAYEIAAEIGKGAYGTVYKARDMRNNGQFVALKEIRILTNTEEGIPMSTIREIALLRQLEKFEHPNIVRLLDVWTGQLNIHEMKLMLVFEHMDQDLAQYLEKSPSCGLGPDNIKDLMQQILNGVDFLHTNRIVHRDLKPQNILVSNKGCIKIADFGLARIYAFSMALTSVVVTLYYRAPEILLQESYCSAVDLWSCGAILAELYLKRPLFQGTSEIDQLCKIFHVRGLPPYNEWPATCVLPRSSFKEKPKQPAQRYVPNMEHAAIDLLDKLLIFDQRGRISAAAALKHHWFHDDESDMSASSLSLSALSHDSSLSSLDNMEAVSGPVVRDKCVVDGTVPREDLPNELLACESPLVDSEVIVSREQIVDGVNGAGAMYQAGHSIAGNQHGPYEVPASVDGRIGPCGINILLPTTRPNSGQKSCGNAGVSAMSGVSHKPYQPPMTTMSNLQPPPPSTIMNHVPPPPSTIINHIQQLPATTMNHFQQPPSTIMNHIQQLPSTTMNHIQPPPATTMNHIQPPPAMTMNHIQPPPATTMNHIQPPPATTMNHIQPPPATTMNHIQPPPATTMNHIQQLYRPSATIASAHQPLSTNHAQEPLSISSTLALHTHQPLETNASHLPNTYQVIATNGNNVQRPYLPLASNNHGPELAKAQTNLTTHAPSSQQQLPTINHIRDHFKPSVLTASCPAQEPHKHATVLSTNTAVMNVPGHSRVCSNDTEMTNNSERNTYYTSSSNTVGGLSSLESHRNTGPDVHSKHQNGSDAHTKHQNGSDAHAKHHASYVFGTEDINMQKKGIKRSWPC